MFKITNMRFDYTDVENPQVEINWSVSLPSNTLSGITKVSLDEFNGVTGIVGYESLMKTKVIDSWINYSEEQPDEEQENA